MLYNKLKFFVFNYRSRDSPYIGHVLAGSEWVDRTIWYSSIWYCLYGDSILPPAEIIIK